MLNFIILILTNATLILAQEFDVAQKPQQTRIGVGIMLTKQWLPIKGYEGLYEISNFGKVRSLERKVPTKRGYFLPKASLVLITRIDRNGYECVQISKNNKKQSCRIHTLVWDHFGDELRDGRKIVVDHIDANKRNNIILNLQLLKHRDNVAKTYQDKGRKLPSGVVYVSQRQKYRACIQVNRKYYYLGYFLTIEEASLVYQKAVKELT